MNNSNFNHLKNIEILPVIFIHLLKFAFAGVFIAGSAAGWYTFFKPQWMLQDKNNLKKLNGHISKYDNIINVDTSYDFNFWIKEYPQVFFKAVSIDAGDYIKFRQEIKEGSRLSFYIEDKEFDLTDPRPVPVTWLYSENTAYKSPEKDIPFYKLSGIISGILLLIYGIPILKACTADFLENFEGHLPESCKRLRQKLDETRPFYFPFITRHSGTK